MLCYRIPVGCREMAHASERQAMNNNGIGLFLTILAAMYSVSAHAETSDRGVFSWSTAILSGDIDGFLQTPDGGMPGRTDRHRPTFDELGIDSTNNFEFAVNLDKGPAHYYAAATIIGFEETLTLESPLLSQWIQFDTGDRVSADIKMNWYRFGYRRSFTIDSIPKLSYSLGGDIAAFDFHYQLDSGNKQVDRSYMKAGYRIGMALDYAFNERSTLNLTLYNSLPFPNTVEITTIDLSSHYNLWRRDTTGSLIFGLSYHRINYQDEQEVPNHIVGEMSPMFRFGFALTMAP